MAQAVDPIKSTDWLQSKAALVPFTLDQYHRMIRDGLVAEGAPVEFIDGFLVLKDRSQHGSDPMTVYPPHSLAVQKVGRLDGKVQALGLHVRTQQPITLPTGSEPEPDGAIVRGPAEDFGSHHPGPSEILCVIEVADSSLDYDRTTKQRIYAAAGIPQYVLINLVDRVIEVRREPDAKRGVYASSELVRADGFVVFQLAVAGRITVAANELLPA